MRKNEELETLSLVAKYTNNMVLIINDVSEITWVNDAFIQKMKYSLDEVLSKRPGDFLNGPLSGQQVGTNIRTAIKKRHPFREEIIHYTKDQLPIWILADGQPIFDNSGKLIKYVIVETDITLQKHQDELLKRTESELNAFFNSSGSILILFDNSLRITTFNKKSEAFIQNHFKVGIQIGTPILNIFKIFEIEKFGEFALDTLKGQGRENIEFQLKKLGIWWNIRFLSIYDSFGTIIGGSFTALDFTERKKIEINLKQSEERFSLVSKATFDAIWDWDIEKNTLFRGEGYFTLFGYETGVLKNDTSNWDNLIHKDDFKKVVTGFQKKLDSGVSKWEEEYRFLKSDGTYAYVRDKAIIIRDDSGRAIRMVGAMNDISIQVQREEQLKLLGSVITNTNDAIVITDSFSSNGSGLRIIYVNEAFTKMTGYLQEEIIGNTPKILQGPLTDKNELKRLKLALENSKPCEIETINYKKNGDPFWVNLSIVPVANEKSEYTHWIAIQKDVTERRKQMEEREQMIHALTQNNNELRQFSYITSHNLRGPLTNMIGILNLIETSSISDTRMQDLIDGLKKSTLNLNETLNDLIKILIIKENSQISIEKIHFQTKLNKVIDSIKKTIQDSGTIVEYDFSQAEYVYFSRVYLQSILFNLISNAIKYRHPDVNPRIKIRSTIFNGSVQLHISDNGLGMNWEKVKNKIFGLYQRFHNHIDSKGIGLYLVYAQVTALGGLIELKTEVEKGSTFIITFKNERLKTL
jgi:PAS domain S-box-containing protein